MPCSDVERMDCLPTGEVRPTAAIHWLPTTDTNTKLNRMYGKTHTNKEQQHFQFKSCVADARKPPTCATLDLAMMLPTRLPYLVSSTSKAARASLLKLASSGKL